MDDKTIIERLEDALLELWIETGFSYDEKDGGWGEAIHNIKRKRNEQRK